MVQNKTMMYRAIPTEMPEKGKHLEVTDQGFELDAEPPQGGITLRNFYSSFDPYMRGRMRNPEVKSYTPAFEVNSPVTNDTISRVLKSNNSDFQPGDIVKAHIPIQEYTTLPEKYIGLTKCQKIENPSNIDIKSFLGALGMPGITAYSSLYEIGQPKEGETMFVSAASGAVGSLVGQLAKHAGLKVIGSVGDDEKLKYILEELHFDSGFNYKKEKPAEALNRLAPDGIDIYYDNVGGETLQAAFDRLNFFGRVVACGMISQYNLKPADQIPLQHPMDFVRKRILLRGFIQLDKDFAPKWGVEHQKNVGEWIADGSIKDKLHVTKGMDQSVEGLLGIFSGKNFGKAVLEIADFDSST